MNVMVPQTNHALTIEIDGVESTETLARRLSGLLLKGDVVMLQGPLGAGKSVFARAVIRGLGWRRDEIPSPTFTLVQQYELPVAMVWHFDLYRLEIPDDVFELGIEDAFYDGISLIEWPDRLGGYVPQEYLNVAISFVQGETSRHIQLNGTGNWPDRLQALQNA